MRFVQIISSVGSPQPCLLSSPAPFVTVRCRRPLSSLRPPVRRTPSPLRAVAAAALCYAMRAAAVAACGCCAAGRAAAALPAWAAAAAALLAATAAAACGCCCCLRLRAAGRCCCFYAAPAHTAARKKLPFNISILIFSIFYVSNFNILFSQFHHFERQMLNIFNKMLI